MAKEIEETDEVIAEVERTFIQTDDVLSKIGEQNVYSTPTHLAEMNGALNNSQVSSDSTGKIVRTKLLKLWMKNFGGKFCEWPEFWDSFWSSIDHNDQLSDVDKFAYSICAGIWKDKRNRLSPVFHLQQRITSAL